ncbi:hypothetical protein [Polynucleobacter alcilacus]|uniref:hypothetical protein n=1 Tax=Polynucleobacter alcilacus TaxID=1819739 RepID=UPI001C0AD200|nr:hypothetical protein [Polynucleobacter alcilacus]MBU3567459.1 hypothetical protein [Polynucleobacter alcilacus]
MNRFFQQVNALFKNWLISALYFSVWFCALTFYNEAALHLEPSAVRGYGFAIFQAVLLARFLTMAELILPTELILKHSVYLAILFRTTGVSILVMLFRLFSIGLEGLFYYKPFLESILNFFEDDIKHGLAVFFMYWLIIMPYIVYGILKHLAGERDLEAHLLASRNRD